MEDADSDTYMMILEIGRIKEAKSIILRQGTIRLGAPDETITTAVNAIEDIERLHRLEDRLLDAANWRELLEMP